MAVSELSMQVPASCRPGEKERTKRNLSEVVEEYVEGIYRIREDREKVVTGDLAEYMCVSAGSATAMVKKLTQLGLTKHTPYKSIKLTSKGEKLAKQLTRTHRILKRFLVEVVGLPWNDVHELACKLEHFVSADVVKQMYEKLGKPKTCPHGTPIDPNENDKSIRLSEASPDKKLCVVKITNERYEFLKFIEDCGLLPGTGLMVTGSTEFDGLTHLLIGGKTLTVGREVSRHVWVRKS